MWKAPPHHAVLAGHGRPQMYWQAAQTARPGLQRARSGDGQIAAWWCAASPGQCRRPRQVRASSPRTAARWPTRADAVKAARASGGFRRRRRIRVPVAPCCIRTDQQMSHLAIGDHNMAVGRSDTQGVNVMNGVRLLWLAVVAEQLHIEVDGALSSGTGRQIRGERLLLCIGAGAGGAGCV